MNRHQYLETLRKKLKRLPKEDLDDAMDYYTEYFEEANDDESVIQSLGSPIFVANQILASRAMKDIEENPNSTKKGLAATWISIKTVLSAQNSIVTLLILALIIFIGVAAIATILAGAYIFTVAAVGFGSYLIFVGFSAAKIQTATGIVFIGAGIFLLGLCILLCIFSIALTRWLILWMVKVSKSSLSKIKRER